MKPYIFWPKPWRHYSGGARVLYYLCHYLNEAGVKAYMPYPHKVDWLNVPRLHGALVEREIRKGAIAIYPERVEGNRWGAKTAVRFLLHEPGYFGGPTEFPGEHIYTFSRLISDEKLLWVPTVEKYLFNTHGRGTSWTYRRRDGCFYVGKGKNSPRIPETEGLLELTLDNAPTREALAGILRASTVLYTYDDYTLLVWEARLCGCPVVVIPNRYSREDYQQSEMGINGIAFSPEELPRARHTLPQAKEDYRWLERAFERELQQFVEVTQCAAT